MRPSTFQSSGPGAWARLEREVAPPARHRNRHSRPAILGVAAIAFVSRLFLIGLLILMTTGLIETLTT